jgi:hypothetical protein
MKKDRDVVDKICKPFPKGDVSLDLMITLSKYAEQLQKESQTRPPYYDEIYQQDTDWPEDMDKDFYETKVD